MSGDKRSDLTSVAKLYSDSLTANGVSSKSVGWPDPESHRLRFEQLAKVVRGAKTPYTMNDLGCGYGAFYEFLLARGDTISHFRGYDISKEMLAEARRRIRSPDAEFLCGQAITETADYSSASGIFNVRLAEGEDAWQQHVLSTLDNLAAHSRLGFSFNLLSSYVDWKEEHLHYGDPREYFDYCKRKISPRVTLIHDYPLWEWTMIVRMER